MNLRFHCFSQWISFALAAIGLPKASAHVEPSPTGPCFVGRQVGFDAASDLD